jgi:hypothetical protein
LVTPERVDAVQPLLGVDRRSTEMKFTSEQRVFIVEFFARKKLTENVSASFVLNILTRQFPQRRVYPSL